MSFYFSLFLGFLTVPCLLIVTVAFAMACHYLRLWLAWGLPDQMAILGGILLGGFFTLAIIILLIGAIT